MKTIVRAFGWLLFALSTLFTLLGMLALGDMIDDPTLGLFTSPASKNDRVLFVVAWLLGMLAGLWLAKPRGKRDVEI